MRIYRPSSLGRRISPAVYRVAGCHTDGETCTAPHPDPERARAHEARLMAHQERVAAELRRLGVCCGAAREEGR